MSWLDIVIIVVAILFGVLGLWQGAIKAIFAIAGVIGGIALAGHYYQQFAALLSPGGASWAKITAYAIILIATLVVAGVIGWLVAKLAHITMLGWVDKLVGFFLGAGIGAMLCAAALAIVSKYFPSVEADITQSVVARWPSH